MPHLARRAFLLLVLLLAACAQAPLSGSARQPAVVFVHGNGDTAGRERPVPAQFNGETIVMRNWPASENRISVAEFHY